MARISFGFPRVNPASQRAIVGVVNDVKYTSLWSSADPAFYLVQDQAGNTQRQSIVVATEADDPTTLIPAIRSEVQKLDPQIALTVEPVTALVESTLTRQKLGTTLMLLFAAIAVLLATIGIYGMIAYATAAWHRRLPRASRWALPAAACSGCSPGRGCWWRRRARSLASASRTAPDGWLRAGCTRCARPIRSSWSRRLPSSSASRWARRCCRSARRVGLLRPSRFASNDGMRPR